MIKVRYTPCMEKTARHEALGVEHRERVTGGVLESHTFPTELPALPRRGDLVQSKSRTHTLYVCRVRFLHDGEIVLEVAA